MQLFNSTKNYGAIPQALHWLTVFLVALAWALGIFDDVLPKGGPRDAGLFPPGSRSSLFWWRVQFREWSIRLRRRKQPNLAHGWESGWILLPGSRTLPFMRCWSQSRSLGLCCSLRVVMRCRYLVWPKFHRHGSKIVPSPKM